MATKNTKPAQSHDEAPLSAQETSPPLQPAKGAAKPAPAKSRAKIIQEHSEQAASQPMTSEERLATTLRTDVGFEYHLDLPRSVVQGIIDPDVPDAFIEVPCKQLHTRRFLHTSYVKEVDVRGL
jgi:hypothetical protein